MLEGANPNWRQLLLVTAEDESLDLRPIQRAKDSGQHWYVEHGGFIDDNSRCAIYDWCTIAPQPNVSGSIHLFRTR